MADFDITCLLPGLLQAKPRLLCAECDQEIPVVLDLDGRPQFEARVWVGHCSACDCDTTIFDFGPGMPERARRKFVKAFMQD